MAVEITPQDYPPAIISLFSEIKNRLPLEKYDRFLEAMHDFKYGRRSRSETTRIVVGILEGEMDLIQKFHNLPRHNSFRTDNGGAAPLALDFVNRIGMRDRELQKMVLEVLDLYNKRAIGKDELHREVVELLKGYPELLDGIGGFLPAQLQQRKPYSRKIGDRGDRKAAEVEEEEQRVSKRARSGNEFNYPQREKLVELILQNRKKLSPSRLYRYSGAIGDLGEEIRTTLSRLKPPPAAVVKEKERRRITNKEAETEKETEKVTETETETETLVSEPKRLTPCYLPLQPERKPRSSAILNTSCVSVASVDYDLDAVAERRRQREVDSREEKLNRMEDDLFEADMAKSYLLSAVDYAEGETRGNEMGKIHFRKCLEALYGGEEALEISATADPEVLGRVVGPRLCQKIAELEKQQRKMTAKHYLPRHLLSPV